MLEDSDTDAEMVQQFLKKEKIALDFSLVMDREAFVQALDEFKPDLILSDNSMPQFSAREALEIVNERSSPIPFILVTGTVSEEFAANIIKLGADDYILKDRLHRLPAAIEAALKKRKAESEIRFNATLLNAVGQAVIATDMAGKVIYWNKAAEKIYGWTNEEALGRNIVELTPAQQTKEEATEIMQRLMEGDSWSGEFLVQRKDGTVFMAFVADSPVYNEQGVVSAIIGVSSDISERKKTESALLKMEQEILNQKIQEQKKITRAVIKAQEKERNYIGQELHDNVNQILAGTKIYLTMAGKKDAVLKELVKYPLELIDNSINEIRTLSSNYVTPLKDVNLKEMVETLLINLHKATEIKTSFMYNMTDNITDDDLKLNIYRIIQEELNNVLKHAEAKNVDVLIEAANHNINIVVADDGKGFDTGKKRKGIGVSNILNRIESFNGEVEIKSSPGNGCKISVTIPY